MPTETLETLSAIRCPKCGKLFMMADINLGRAEIKCTKCGWLCKFEWPEKEKKAANLV